MILHIGANHVVFARDIIAIVDSQCAAASSLNRESIARAKRAGHFFAPTDEIASYVFTVESGEDHVYGSPLTSATLANRCNSMADLRASQPVWKIE